MLRSLEKHLPQFKKTAGYPNSAQMPHPGGYVTPNSGQAPLGLNMGQLSASQSLKDDASPGKSPATTSSWQSPIQMPNQSPIGPSPGSFMQQPMQDNRQYNMPQTHSIPQTVYPAPQNPGLGAPRAKPHRRGMSDMTGTVSDDRSEKRQRLYQPQGQFPQ